jgi:poly(3-hydroxybutyrate) depolymerase
LSGGNEMVEELVKLIPNSNGLKTVAPRRSLGTAVRPARALPLAALECGFQTLAGRHGGILPVGQRVIDKPVKIKLPTRVPTRFA